MMLIIFHTFRQRLAALGYCMRRRAPSCRHMKVQEGALVESLCIAVGERHVRTHGGYRDRCRNFF
jgi:hypothetical protein